jgi:hypothetical protein
MRLHTLWKLWDDDLPELLFALDEYTVEANYGAWVEGCAAACKRYGIVEGLDTREVIVHVGRKPIVEAFQAVEVSGSVGHSVASQDNQGQEA